MIRLVNRSGAEVRVQDEAQAEFWRALGYRAPEAPKKAAAKRPAKK